MIRPFPIPLICASLISLGLTAKAESFNRYFDSETLKSKQRFGFKLRDDIDLAIVEVRGAVSDNKERLGLSKSWWRVGWGNNAGDSLSVTLRWGNTDYTTDYDVRFLRLNINFNDSTIYSKDIVDGVDLDDGYNSLWLMFTSDGKLEIDLGNRTLRHQASNINIDGFPSGNVIVDGCEGFSVERIAIREDIDIKRLLQTSWTVEKLTDYIKSSTDKNECIWEYLDRENDTSLARMGGQYTLATVSNGHGYDIIYLSGAVTQSEQWTPGMIKGVLEPTIFCDEYNLVWYDSEMKKIDKLDEAGATITNNSILTLRFPLFSTQLRYSKKLLR